jgi:hypothetical protein
MSVEARIALPLGATRNEPGWQAAVNIVRGAERQNRPYVVELYWPPTAMPIRNSLVESSSSLLLLLHHDVPNLKFMTGLGARRTQDAPEAHLTLTIRDAAEREPVTAGILMVDLEQSFTAGGAAADSWARALREVLASNVMARPAAEYALAIDLPMPSGDNVGPELLAGMALARDLSLALPAESGAESNLVEFSLRVGQDAAADRGAVRLRVWRLGFMKIPSRSRFA